MVLPAELITSISGIRGVSPRVLSPAVVYAITFSFLKTLPPGKIVVSRDTRFSGYELKKAVLEACRDVGRGVLDADIVPLPSTQIAIKEYGAAGGIDITASHNPAEYNGLKLLNNEGVFIDEVHLGEVLNGLVEVEEKDVFTDACVFESIQEQAIEHHIQKVLDKAIEGRPLTIAVDAVNGAGSIIVPRLLERMNCKVIAIATDPTKPFPHIPEPLPENLVWTQEQLRTVSFDVCVVVDPDADRLVLIDETGRILPEESTVPLVVQELIAQGKVGSVVVNMSTSRMVEDVANASGVKVHRSRVGEKNVVDKMKQEGCFFGGEGGGGIIDPDVHFGRDSLVGIVAIINLMRRTGKRVSELYEALPHYEMRKDKITFSHKEKMPELYGALKESLQGGVYNEEDGLRIKWGDLSWVHIRPSNTEPVVRVIGEAKTPERLGEMFDSVYEIIRKYQV